jgi:hypothetical protein
MKGRQKISPERMFMSKTNELDLQIQHSLVARIRQAAHSYQAAPTETRALESYVTALESLAAYVSAKCREAQPIPFPERPVSDAPKAKSISRVIQFPSPVRAPLGAA